MDLYLVHLVFYGIRYDSLSQKQIPGWLFGPQEMDQLCIASMEKLDHLTYHTREWQKDKCLCIVLECVVLWRYILTMVS